MDTVIVEILNEFGYLGIVTLIAVENIFPPIPSEVILTLGGFMTLHTTMTKIGVIVFATLGAALGAVVLYFIGRLLPEERLKQLVTGRLGRMLRFKEQDIEKAVIWFNKRGKYTVFFCRCIPIVRSLISIPAGMAKMNFFQFMVFTISGSFIWNTVLVMLGYYAQDTYYLIVERFDVFSNVAAVILAAGVIAGSIIFYRKRLKKTE